MPIPGWYWGCFPNGALVDIVPCEVRVFNTKTMFRGLWGYPAWVDVPKKMWFSDLPAAAPAPNIEEELRS